MTRTDATERQALRRTSRKLRRLRGDLRTLANARPADLTAAQQRQAIVLLADEGWTISSTERLQRLGMPRGGTHGYDNFLPSMGALFVAAGPDIQLGRVIGPVANVHVYPLLARLLGITPAPNDGSPDSLAILRR